MSDEAGSKKKSSYSLWWSIKTKQQNHSKENGKSSFFVTNGISFFYLFVVFFYYKFFAKWNILLKWFCFFLLLISLVQPSKLFARRCESINSFSYWFETVEALTRFVCLFLFFILILRISFDNGLFYGHAILLCFMWLNM